MYPYFPSDFFFNGIPTHWAFQRPAPPLAADEELAMRVAAKLRENLTGTAYRIVVEVQNRVVILEGAVPAAALRTRLHHLVWQVPGVTDVCNCLTTGRGER